MQGYETVIQIIRNVERPDELTWQRRAFYALRKEGYPCIVEPASFIPGKASRRFPCADLYIPNLLVELKIPHGFVNRLLTDFQRSVTFQGWCNKLLEEVAIVGADWAALMIYKGPTIWLNPASGVQPSLPGTADWHARCRLRRSPDTLR